MNPIVRAQLERTGYLGYIREMHAKGEQIEGTLDLALLPFLAHDARFEEGPLSQLHQDVGHDLVDYRGKGGTFGEGSLHLVIDRITGRFSADHDTASPYDGAAPFVVHGVWDVIPGWIKGLFRRKPKA